MASARVGQFDLAHVLGLLIDTCRVVPVAARIRVEVAGQSQAGAGGGLGARGLDARERGALDLLELAGVETRLAQDFGDQREAGFQAGARHFEAGAAAADIQARAQARDLVADFLAILRPCAAHEHGAGERAGLGAAEFRLFVAVLETQAGADHAAARFFRQEGDLDPVRKSEAAGARVDAGRRQIERFAAANAGRAGVILERELEVGRERDGGALRRIRLGNENADGAVGGDQMALRGAIDRRRGHVVQGVAVAEEQAPVAQRDPFAHLGGELMRLGHHHVHLGQHALLRAGDFVLGDRVGGEIFDGGDKRLAHLRELRGLGGDRAGFATAAHTSGGRRRDRLRRRRGKHQGAALGEHAVRAVDAGGELLLHQGLVQAPGRGVAEDQGEQVEGGVVGMAAGRGVIQRGDQAGLAGAPQGDLAFAVLRRVLRVGGRQHARRLRDRAEMPGRQRQRVGRVEVAGDHQHGVVGLVVGAVERLQARDRHVFDVGSVADHGAPIVVPLEGGARDFLRQHARDIVLARFELVAHDGHFGIKVAFRDERIDHAVGFEAERPFEVVARRVEGQEVIGAVEIGGAVPARAARSEFALDLAVLGRALEQQVFKQVGHPGLAITLVARADQVGDVGGDQSLRTVLDQQHREAVGQAVFGDAAHRRAGGDAGRRLRRGGHGKCKAGDCQEKLESLHERAPGRKNTKM